MTDQAVSPGMRRLLVVFFVLLVLFLYLPIVLLAVFSFNSGDASFPLAGFTLDWYRRFLANPKILTSLERSAIVAAISSVIAVGLGGRGLLRLAPAPVRRASRPSQRCCSRRSWFPISCSASPCS